MLKGYGCLFAFLLLIMCVEGSYITDHFLNFCNTIVRDFGNDKAVHLVLDEDASETDNFETNIAELSSFVKVQFVRNTFPASTFEREELIIYPVNLFHTLIGQFDMNQMNKDVWFVPQAFKSKHLDQNGSTFLRLDSEVYIYNDDSINVPITEVYGIKGIFKQRSTIAFWDDLSGFVWTGDVNPLDRRTNWTGVTLVGAVQPFPPITIVNMDSNGTVLGITGIVSEVFNIMQETLGFEADIYRPADGAWSVFLPNGTVKGLVGLLHRHEIDISPVSLMFTEERARVCDYSIPLYHSYFALSGLRSSKALVNFMAFIQIFTTPSWLVIFGILVILVTVITVSVIKVNRERMHGKHDVEEFTLFNSLAMVFTMLLQREYPAFPTRPPARIAYLSSSLVSFILFSVYAAVLTSLMTAGGEDINIRSFKDVLANGYQPMVQASSGAAENLRTAPVGSSMRTMYDEGMRGKDAFYKDIPEAVEKIRNDPTIIAISTELNYLSYPDIVTIRPSDTYRLQLGFGFPKDSEIKPSFDHFLAKAIESGVMENIRLQYVKEEIADQDQEAFELGYNNVFFPCTILAVGIATAVLVIAAEKCLRFSSKKTQQSDPIPVEARKASVLDFKHSSHFYTESN